MILKPINFACVLCIMFVGNLQAQVSDTDFNANSHRPPIHSKKTHTEANPAFLGYREIDYNSEHPILGISAIRHDSKSDDGTFWLLSDDTGYTNNTLGFRGRARLYSLPESTVWNNNTQAPDSLDQISYLTLHSASVQPVTISSNPSIKDTTCGRVDTESFDFMDNGELLIASEQSPGWGLCWNDPLPTLVIPPLSKFDYLPESFFLKVSRLGVVNGIYFLPHELTGEGIQINKGIESVSRFPGGDNFVAVFEGPLRSDFEARNSTIEQIACAREYLEKRHDACIYEHKVLLKTPVRVLFFSLSELKHHVAGRLKPDVYYYTPEKIEIPQDKLNLIKSGFPKKRITDVQAVNDSQFLVLETTYMEFKAEIDPASPEGKKAKIQYPAEDYLRLTTETRYSYAEVFLLERPDNLPEAASENPQHARFERTLDKRLVLSTKTFEQEEDKQWLGQLNFEGITLGRTLSDGTKTLILVNDNDALASNPIKTRLVFFKVNGQLFKEMP